MHTEQDSSGPVKALFPVRGIIRTDTEFENAKLGGTRTGPQRDAVCLRLQLLTMVYQRHGAPRGPCCILVSELPHILGLRVYQVA